MAIARGISTGEFAGYKACEKCNAGFKDLYIGGEGDWRQTIMCEACFHVRRGIPLRIIHELIAEQYPNIGTADAAKKADESSNACYHGKIARWATDPTSPASTDSVGGAANTSEG
mgnify:CR=1 FL=1|jgi:hypothetical protein